MTLLRKAFLAGAALAALTHPALSQDEPVYVLGGITLTLDDVSGYVSPGAQIGKSSTRLSETQQSVSVVTRQQIEDQGARNLGQVLSYTAGVVAQPFGTDPRFDSPVIRGFDGSRAQYVNGLRQLRDLGAPTYETYGLQQVEVLRGPSSSLYGAGSPGGIINQVQKRARSGDFSEAGFGFDSNGSLRAFMDLNRSPSETLSWRLTGLGSDTSQQIEELTNRRGYLAGAVRLTPQDGTVIDLMASTIQDAPVTPAQVPYALTQIGNSASLRKLHAGEPSFEGSDRNLIDAGAEISHLMDNGWTLSQGFRVERLDWDYTGLYVTGLTGDQITRGIIAQDESSDSISLDTRLTGEIVTGAVTHRILAGLDLRRYEASADTRFGSAPSLDWRNPVFGVAIDPSYWFIRDRDVTLRQAGIYVQDEIEAGAWRGNLALRHDWAEQTGRSVDNLSTEARIDQRDNATTGRVGLGYVFANGVMPYMGYSTSFDPEIGADIDGNALRPTEGRQVELGVKYDPSAWTGLVSAALYDLRQTNVSRTVTEGGITGQRQFGEVASRGLELEATAELAEGWALRASYAWNETEQKGGATAGRALPNAPRHVAGLWLDRDLGNGWRLGGGLRHVGNRFGDAENTLPLEGATLADLGATYTSGALTGSVNIRNLGDKAWLANCGAFGCTYADGRTLDAQVTWKW